MEWRPGPGLIIAAAFLGPGTLTTATVAGAEAGYGLLWVVPLAVGLTFALQEVAARLPLATGEPLARLLDEETPGPPRVGRWLAIGSVGAIVLGAAAFQAGNLAGAALGLETLGGDPALLWVIACADVAFLLLWFGRYELLETTLAALVTVMAAAFGFQVALVGIDGARALEGLVPSLDAATIGLVLALLGTTVVPYNLFLHGSALAQRGDEGEEAVTSMRWDLGFSVVIGGLATASVLLSSALTLEGATIRSAADMAVGLSILLGPLAEGAFSVGLAAAGLSSAITAPLAAAWAVDELRGGDRGERPPRVVWIPVLLVGATVALLPLEPVALIVAAQVANALVLPVLAGALLLLANRARVGEQGNGWLANAAGGLAVLVTVLLVVQLLL